MLRTILILGRQLYNSYHICKVANTRSKVLNQQRSPPPPVPLPCPLHSLLSTPLRIKTPLRRTSAAGFLLSYLI